MDTANIRKTTRSLLKSTMAGLGQSLVPLRVVGGRLRYLSPFPRRFTGAYASFEEAVAAAGTASLVGYDHDAISTVAFEQMCRVMPWDYPVLFWLRSLLDEIDGVVDAGGHMGTKYRAFRDLLPLDAAFTWIVYDVPTIVAAGRKRAVEDGLSQLSFINSIEEAPETCVFLGSGLLQYLDIPLATLLGGMQSLPRHLLLNKVAFHKSGLLVTLERIGEAYVPYQMRDEGAFLREMERMGYRLVDRWAIPELSHVIETHPELGPSESAGFYLRRDNERSPAGAQ